MLGAVPAAADSADASPDPSSPFRAGLELTSVVLPSRFVRDERRHHLHGDESRVGAAD